MSHLLPSLFLGQKITGQPTGFQEVVVADATADARSSLSLTRSVGSAANQTFGSTLQKPFFPGGLDSEERKQRTNHGGDAATDTSDQGRSINHELFTGLLTQVGS